MSNHSKYINPLPPNNANEKALKQQVNEPDEFDLDELDLHSNDHNHGQDNQVISFLVI